MAPIHEAAENFDIEALRRELTPRRTRAGSIYDKRSLPAPRPRGGRLPQLRRAHLTTLANTLSPKLAHLLPPELVRKVVEFYLHAGFYPFTAAKAPATAPTA